MQVGTTKPKVLLLGTRGIPAAHGGFETFVGYLAPFLVEQGWDVSVYCQEQGTDAIWEDDWNGVRRIHVSVKGAGTLGTIIFDWLSMRDALKREGALISFGYPTAIFAVLPRLARRFHAINMDGVEWKRSQFGFIGKSWLYLNERIACRLGNVLIADHPRIADHLATRAPRSKIETIAYGAEEVKNSDPAHLEQLGLEPDNFAVVIARPEPDNSIYEIVAAFSRKPLGKKLVVLGKFFPDENSYHKKILDVASSEVIFPGAIYDRNIVHALRQFARFYVHGHRVGGTNPSLVEALGAGSAILAHDNMFNAWVAGKSALWFEGEEDCAPLIVQLFEEDALVERLRENAREQFKSFTWPAVLSKYESVLKQADTRP